jgi:hypothetical protein
VLVLRSGHGLPVLVTVAVQVLGMHLLNPHQKQWPRPLPLAVPWPGPVHAVSQLVGGVNGKPCKWALKFDRQ